MKISVISSTFSANKQLVNKLRESFPDIRLNNTGKRYNSKELIENLKDSQGAIIGLDVINEEILKNCPELKVISKYGVGVDNIDFEACKRQGVEVKWKKGVNKRSVAELTLGMILGLIRNLHTTSLQMKKGIWNKSGGKDLSKKTIGIIGVGNVGKDLIKLLKPFECNVLVNDIIKQDGYYKENNLKEVSKDFIFKNSDIVTIHTSLTESTRGLVNEKNLSLMKPTSSIINTSRGGVVDETALYRALTEKKISGAALDVYFEEPPKNKKLIEMDNVICTPHIAGNSKEAVIAMGDAAIQGLKDFFENEFRK